MAEGGAAERDWERLPTKSHFRYYRDGCVVNVYRHCVTKKWVMDMTINVQFRTLKRAKRVADSLWAMVCGAIP